MTNIPQSSGDCTILKTVWSWLWEPSNQFYLPNIILKGLNIPGLGINIAPFDTVAIGDLPEITMFQEPVLGYMKITLTDNSVKNLHNVAGSNFSCDDSSPQATTTTFQLAFNGLELSGNYTVSAGGGIAGCAIAGAAKILGGDTDLVAGPSAASPVDQHIDLALWYRDPLAQSANGQILLGAYEEHNDAIYDLQQEPNNAFNQALKAANVQSSTTAVTTATQYYRDQQTGQLSSQRLEAEAPKVGTTEQYASGMLPYAYLLAMARAKAGSSQDSDNRYAKLQQAMTHFLGSIDYVQKTYPGEHAVGGDDGILAIIAKADPQDIQEYVLAKGSYDIVHPQTGELIVTVEPQPLDYSSYQQVYRQAIGRSTSRSMQAATSAVDGKYSDTNITVDVQITGSLSNDNGKLKCTITRLQATVSSIDIRLEQSRGWWPGLYDKVTNWIANTSFVKDLIKSKISDQLSSDTMKSDLGNLITGALQSIAFKEDTMADLEANLQRQTMLQAKFDQFLEAVKDKPGFVKAGIGFVQTSGQSTGKIGFIVFVNKKLPRRHLTAEAMMPSEYDGEPVDVVEYREPRPQSKQTRPLVGGIQCTADANSTSFSYGTLGCCARRNSDGKAVLLSNHHVLYGSTHNDGDTVYQPQASCCGCNSVGKNAKGVLDNKIDAAIAVLDGAGGTNTIKDIGTITGVTGPVLGMAVQKNGVRTGQTQGTITTVFPIPSGKTGFYVETSNPQTDRFSNHGDSGSVIVNNSLQVVGLLWGGSDSAPFFTACCNISDVVSEMDITIPNPDLTSLADAELVREVGFIEDPRLQKYEQELNQSANGRGALRVLKSQIDEVGNLVHHNRAVTVAWYENKGPDFLKAYQVAEDQPTQPLPKEIDGVTIQTMLTNMGTALAENGSASLKSDIDTYGSSVLSVVGQVDSLQQLTDAINGKTVHCWLLNFVWQQMWNPSSEFFLPTVARNGLRIPDLGIDIPPFATVNVGDLPEMVMFQEPVLGYMKILLTNSKVSGLDTAQQGTLQCSEREDGSVAVDLSLTFGKIDFDGNYTVSAGGGIAGCAIAGAAKILGGDTDLVAGPSAASPVDQHIDLALWYRDPLAQSANGQILLGAYEEHNDAIYDLQQEPNNAFNQALKAANVQSSTTAVTTATQYYRDQQTGQLSSQRLKAEVPKVGATEQYASGMLPYAYLLAMARAKAGSGQDSDNRYAKLQQAMTHFLGSIDYVQKTYPGEHAVGGDDGILAIIAQADPQSIQEYVLAKGSYDIVHPQTGELIVTVEPQPLDYSSYQQVYRQAIGRSTSRSMQAATSAVDGTFSDEGVYITLATSLTISGNLSDSPQVDVSALSAQIGSLSITLQQSQGWWPGLYDKVTNWIANTFVTDLLKSHINDALGSQAMRDNFAHIIEGVLKRKG